MNRLQQGLRDLQGSLQQVSNNKNKQARLDTQRSIESGATAKEAAVKKGFFTDATDELANDLFIAKTAASSYATYADDKDFAKRDYKEHLAQQQEIFDTLEDGLAGGMTPHMRTRIANARKVNSDKYTEQHEQYLIQSKTEGGQAMLNEYGAANNTVDALKDMKKLIDDANQAHPESAAQMISDISKNVSMFPIGSRDDMTKALSKYVAKTNPDVARALNEDSETYLGQARTEQTRITNERIKKIGATFDFHKKAAILRNGNPTTKAEIDAEIADLVRGESRAVALQLRSKFYGFVDSVKLTTGVQEDASGSKAKGYSAKTKREGKALAKLMNADAGFMKKYNSVDTFEGKQEILATYMNDNGVVALEGGVDTIQYVIDAEFNLNENIATGAVNKRSLEKQAEAKAFREHPSVANIYSRTDLPLEQRKEILENSPEYKAMSGVAQWEISKDFRTDKEILTDEYAEADTEAEKHDVLVKMGDKLSVDDVNNIRANKAIASKNPLRSELQPIAHLIHNNKVSPLQLEKIKEMPKAARFKLQKSLGISVPRDGFFEPLNVQSLQPNLEHMINTTRNLSVIEAESVEDFNSPYDTGQVDDSGNPIQSTKSQDYEIALAEKYGDVELSKEQRQGVAFAKAELSAGRMTLAEYGHERTVILEDMYTVPKLSGPDEHQEVKAIKGQEQFKDRATVNDTSANLLGIDDFDLMRTLDEIGGAPMFAASTKSDYNNGQSVYHNEKEGYIDVPVVTLKSNDIVDEHTNDQGQSLAVIRVDKNTRTAYVVQGRVQDSKGVGEVIYDANPKKRARPGIFGRFSDRYK